MLKNDRIEEADDKSIKDCDDKETTRFIEAQKQQNRLPPCSLISP